VLRTDALRVDRASGPLEELEGRLSPKTDLGRGATPLPCRRCRAAEPRKRPGESLSFRAYPKRTDPITCSPVSMANPARISENRIRGTVTKATCRRSFPSRGPWINRNGQRAQR
jgi:hypothetical protein